VSSQISFIFLNTIAKALELQCTIAKKKALELQCTIAKKTSAGVTPRDTKSLIIFFSFLIKHFESEEVPIRKNIPYIKFFTTIFYFKIFELGKVLFGSNQVLMSLI
jgi:hypothetical protein